MDIELFHQTYIQDMRSMDVAKSLLQKYDEAYKLYQIDPSSYDFLVLIMHDLLHVTKERRGIISYIRSYIDNHPMYGFEVRRITFNNDLPQSIAHYDPCFDMQIMNFSDNFFEISPSCQAFILLHELRHTAQALYLDDSVPREFIEMEAEEFAAHNLPCDICLRVAQDLRRQNPIREPGYLQSHQFNPYISEKKALGLRCKAHSTNPDILQKLEQAFLVQKIYEWRGEIDPDTVRGIDHAMGTVLDRLPDVLFFT